MTRAGVCFMYYVVGRSVSRRKAYWAFPPQTFCVGASVREGLISAKGNLEQLKAPQIENRVRDASSAHQMGRGKVGDAGDGAEGTCAVTKRRIQSISMSYEFGNAAPLGQLSLSLFLCPILGSQAKGVTTTALRRTRPSHHAPHLEAKTRLSSMFVCVCEFLSLARINVRYSCHIFPSGTVHARPLRRQVHYAVETGWGAASQQRVCPSSRKPPCLRPPIRHPPTSPPSSRAQGPSSLALAPAAPVPPRPAGQGSPTHTLRSSIGCMTRTGAVSLP
ncbi:hypothetical protein LZ32DRAFT_56111 [Colletotrichum eremochloae]|nr:hypothetical protein LZ32DRAFT_56111 [Colletotrichum eremochloae]